MGANEFNTDSTAQQTDSSDRAADSRAEEQGELLAAVRAEQRNLAQRISALEVAVADYAQILASNRELRAERAKERSHGVEDNLGSSLEPTGGNQLPDQISANHDARGAGEINRSDRQIHARKQDRGLER